MTLQLVATPVSAPAGSEDSAEELPRCKGCNSRMRPQGTTEAEHPNTVPVWGDSQCRICDYEACGKDPANRFIPVERVNYLASLRADIESSRQRRGIPVTGTRAGRVPITEFLEQIS